LFHRKKEKRKNLPEKKKQAQTEPEANKTIERDREKERVRKRQSVRERERWCSRQQQKLCCAPAFNVRQRAKIRAVRNCGQLKKLLVFFLLFVKAFFSHGQLFLRIYGNKVVENSPFFSPSFINSIA
jgi:hypothetical protein